MVKGVAAWNPRSTAERFGKLLLESVGVTGFNTVTLGSFFGQSVKPRACVVI